MTSLTQSPTAESSRTIANFGRNVTFQPRSIFEPRSEAELLDILQQVRGRKIRVVGRLHSWSPAVETDDVLIDLRHLNAVVVEQRDGGPWATIGAGCQVKRALAELEQQGLTLPTLGLISEQTLAGATSTGTHGSGRHSLSHYLQEVRVATYDAQSGQPVMRTISQGPELQAARCALGCLGVVISVGLRPVPQYTIEEHFRRYRTIEEVLEREAEYPLQQAYLLPWMWEFFVQHRRVVEKRPDWFAGIYHWYTFFTFDIGLHLAVWTLVKVLGLRFPIHAFLRWIAPLTVIKGWKVAGRSQAMLIMEHELFRHIEVELFVKRSVLPQALAHLRKIMEYLDGQTAAIDAPLQKQLEQLNLWNQLEGRAGSSTFHYFICLRKVLPDDTLISMASAEPTAEPYYAISLISYAWPTQRQGFFHLAKFLTASMGALFDARPHWGKVCSITPQEVERLYPHIKEFRQICNDYDPQGVFRNHFAEQLLFNPDDTPE